MMSINHSFNMYRIMAKLFSKGIHISDIVNKVYNESFYLYGMGEMGQIVLSDSKQQIKGIFDKKVDFEEKLVLKEYGGLFVKNPKHIPQDDLPILISTALENDRIIESLVNQGVKRKRIITLNELLLMGDFFWLKENESHIKYDKEFLIVGANFDNLGSQAMTFVTMDNLRKKYPNCIIWFCPNFNNSIYDIEKYKLIILKDGNEETSTVYDVITRVDAVIDVSGYALASTPGFGNTERILSYIKKASFYNVPYFLMPQSFGPFSFPDYKLAELKILLSKCSLIYGREREGYDYLVKEFKLNNTLYSNDMVLQNKKINKDNIYITKKINITKKENKDKIAIIPNSNLLRYKSLDKIVELYINIIEDIRKNNNRIVIISYEGDLDISKQIYKSYEGSLDVELQETYMDCLELENYLSQFKFIVASRYHTIVFSYRKKIPALIIGWADKYEELSEIMDQKQYCIDIRENIDTSRIISKLRTLREHYLEEKIIIKKKLLCIQKNNCFEKVFSILS